MPTILRSGPYRFFFYSSNGVEPPHIHVEREEKIAKLWLNPLRVQSGGGFSQHELMRIRRLVDQHQDEILGTWNDYFRR